MIFIYMCKMSEHKKRAEKRAENNPPENFTCGKCGKVHPFNEGFNCPDEEEQPQEE